MERLSHEIGVPILEWPDLKAVPPQSTLPIEPLACWSTSEAAIGKQGAAYTLAEERIRVAYWPLPEHVRPVHAAVGESFLSFEYVRVLRAVLTEQLDRGL